MKSPKYREIEHKYTFSSTQELASYIDRCHGLTHVRHSQLVVVDTYFLAKKSPDVVYRFRKDNELCQLTVKELKNDAENRLEVNLNLDRSCSDLEDARAFLAPLGIAFEGAITKALSVFYFEDAEIAIYQAQSLTGVAYCLEIEALGWDCIDTAFSVLDKYERALELCTKERTHSSLFQMLIFPQIPENIRQLSKLGR